MQARHDHGARHVSKGDVSRDEGLDRPGPTPHGMVMSNQEMAQIWRRDGAEMAQDPNRSGGAPFRSDVECGIRIGIGLNLIALGVVGVPHGRMHGGLYGAWLEVEESQRVVVAGHACPAEEFRQAHLCTQWAVSGGHEQSALFMGG